MRVCARLSTCVWYLCLVLLCTISCLRDLSVTRPGHLAGISDEQLYEISQQLQEGLSGQFLRALPTT